VQTDFTLFFGTILLFIVILLLIVAAITLLRRIGSGFTKWRYRRRYNAEFRKNQR